MAGCWAWLWPRLWKLLLLLRQQLWGQWQMKGLLLGMPVLKLLAGLALCTHHI